jgi:hypothetical protein
MDANFETYRIPAQTQQIKRNGRHQQSIRVSLGRGLGKQSDQINLDFELNCMAPTFPTGAPQAWAAGPILISDEILK